MFGYLIKKDGRCLTVQEKGELKMMKCTEADDQVFDIKLASSDQECGTKEKPKEKKPIQKHEIYINVEDGGEIGDDGVGSEVYYSDWEEHYNDKGESYNAKEKHYNADEEYTNVASLNSLNSNLHAFNDDRERHNGKKIHAHAKVRYRDGGHRGRGGGDYKRRNSFSSGRKGRGDYSNYRRDRIESSDAIKHLMNTLNSGKYFPSSDNESQTFDYEDFGGRSSGKSGYGRNRDLREYLENGE